MSKVIITIDKKSVRHNPHKHGYARAGPRTITFKGHAEEWDGKFLCDGRIELSSLKNPVIDQINVEQDTIFHDIHGAPSYLYEYDDVEVTCKECGKKFGWNSLYSDGDWDWYAKDICPKCGESDCCDYEKERLSTEELSKLADKNSKK